MSTLTRTAAGTIVGAGAATTQTWSPTGEPRVLEGRLQTLTQHRDGEPAFVLTVDDASAYRFWELGADGAQRLRGVLTPLAAGWDAAPDSVTISPDGRHLVLVKGPRAELWSAAGVRVANVVGPDHPYVNAAHDKIKSVCFHPDGSRLAVASKTAWYGCGPPTASRTARSVRGRASRIQSSNWRAIRWGR